MKKYILILAAAIMPHAASAGSAVPAPALNDLQKEALARSVTVPDGVEAPAAQALVEPVALSAPVRWEIVPLDRNRDLPSASPAGSKEEFCGKTADPDYFRGLIMDPANRISFRNAGGLINGGVCWWHSFLEQRQIYLTVYRPELPKPTKEQVTGILDSYLRGNAVVEMPGYGNFYDFSLEWHELIQQMLNRWQITDGLTGSWLNGLAGSSKVSSEELRDRMDALFKEVDGRKRIVWQKLQFPGITAHAWLVADMSRTDYGDYGYKLTVIDSNYSRPYTVSYFYGDTAISVPGYPNFVGYTQHLRELDKISRAQKKYCGSN